MVVTHQHPCVLVPSDFGQFVQRENFGQARGGFMAQVMKAQVHQKRIVADVFVDLALGKLFLLEVKA
ncbi:hypothetical protein D3C84_1128590 [compost metagenome]